MILADYRMSIFVLEKSIDLFSAENLAAYVSTMIFAIVNLLITYLILKHILFKPIKKILDKRSKEVDDLLNENRHNVSESEKMKNEYQSKLLSVQNEIQDKYAEANREISVIKEAELKRLEDEINNRRRLAEKEIAMDEAKQFASKESESLSLSLKLLELLYPKLSEKSSLESIIEDARSELDK